MLIASQIFRKYHYKFTVSALFGGAEKLNIIMPLAGLSFYALMSSEL